MKEVNLLPHRWQNETHHKIPFCDAFRMSADAPKGEVKATLTLKAYNLLVEEHPQAAPYIEMQDKGYLLNIPVAKYDGIGRFVLGLPRDVQVTAPEEFKTFLKNRIKNAPLTVVDSQG